MSQILAQAREYEEQSDLCMDQTLRPKFHFNPRIGWLNDPNGFSFYNGEYHLFYQYHPFNTHWGSIYWGHASSKDMVRWEFLPAAMAPDEAYDKDGCWSGSTLTLPDGRQLIMYTGFVRDENDVEGNGTQTQNLAIGDGTNYQKLMENPILTQDDLPEGSGREGFRDPKMWIDDDGYHAITVCRNDANYTQVVLFKSTDAIHWEFDRVLMENHDNIGMMWECPDYFEIDGTKVLLVSAMDMLAEGMEFHSGNNNIYFLGSENPMTGEFEPEILHPLDYGIDLYAAQTMVTPDDRRVMIAWMQNPDTAGLRTNRDPIFGQMTIPRELFIKDGRLCQKPIKEIEQYRTDEVRIENYLLQEQEVELPGITGRYLDMSIEIEPENPEEIFREFRLRFAQNDKFFTEFRYRADKSRVSLDRKYSGQRRAVIRHRDALIPDSQGRLKLRLILDRYSAELFLGDGERVMTMTFVTDVSANRVTLGITGKARLNIIKYTLDENAKCVK